jgi:hypothetical protein
MMIIFSKILLHGAVYNHFLVHGRTCDVLWGNFQLTRKPSTSAPHAAARLKRGRRYKIQAKRVTTSAS